MSSGRILTVDDEPQIRRVLRMTLCTAGYAVADARSGEKAIERLRAEKFDLSVLDVNLPGITGIQTCREIRERSDVPVIMVTMRDSAQDTVAALDAGADDYVTKPFRMEVLLARIRANLRRAPVSPEARAEAVRFGNVEIVSNPDVALPHERILQAVWGPDYGSEVEYLRVFIKQLRKKLEPDPGSPRYILTEHWLGYRFRMSG